jgi:hypothetical protein
VTIVLDTLVPLLARYTVTVPFAAWSSDEGRTMVTVAPLAVTDDTVTLVGVAHLVWNAAWGAKLIT